jgi:hypothetical protein
MIGCEVYLIAGNREWEGEISLGVDGEDPALRDFEPVLIGIVDFKGEIAVRQSLEVEDQLLDNFTLGLHVELALPCVLQGQLHVGASDVLADYSVLGLCRDDEQEEED